jgi:hypothetical protein
MAISSEPLLQKLNVVPSEGNGRQYRDAFRNCAILVMLVSFTATVIWYSMAEWGFRVAVPVAESKRWIWLLLFAVTILTALLVEFLGPAASVNSYIPALFYFLSGAGFYYLATAWFSPVSYKYTPPGAADIRFL